jgi:site-specific recombinase XerD
LREVTITGIDAFIEKKHDEGWTRSSLSVLAGSLRCFFHYAESQGWCAPGLAAAIDSPRLYMREGIPEGPAWEDVQRLLDGACSDSPVDVRDHAILLLLALYGLRRGEAAALSLDDLDWERETICVTRPKTRGSQRYPLLPVVGDAILRYLQEVRPSCQHRELFLALTGPFRPLTARSITAVAHARLTALDIKPPRRGAHCLRHACAGHLLAEGFTLKQIGDHLSAFSVRATSSAPVRCGRPPWSNCAFVPGAVTRSTVCSSTVMASQ